MTPRNGNLSGGTFIKVNYHFKDFLDESLSLNEKRLREPDFSTQCIKKSNLNHNMVKDW